MPARKTAPRTNPRPHLVTDPAAEPLVLAPAAGFTEAGAVVLVDLAGHELTIPATTHAVLLEFRTPRTADEVYAGIEANFPVTEFRGFVRRLVEAGLLVSAAAAAAMPSIETVLRPGLLADRGLRARLRAAIAAGKLCVIRDAFAPAFADGVAGALETEKRWMPYEDFAQPYFHYTHHNLYDATHFSGALKHCHDVFASEATRRFIGALSDVDCSGPVQFGASLYLPGDYSLPHTDRVGPRSLAFLWHLTRNWDPSWGGHLYWVPTQTFIKPTYNTLYLFPVSDLSGHLVCPVTPYAQGRRLTVNGWWTHAPERPEPESIDVGEGTDWVSGGAPFEQLAPDVYTF